MDCLRPSDLKNFGCFCPTKPTSSEREKEFQDLSLNVLREELSLVEQGKMLASVPYNRLRLGRKRFKTYKDRGVSDRDSKDAVLDAISLHKSLSATVGEERALEFWAKTVEKDVGSLILADFFPLAEDFLCFRDPFAALSEYMLEYFRANERAGLMSIEVVEMSANEFRVDVVDCFFHSMAVEAGVPRLYTAISRGDDMFFPKMGEPFAIYERQGTLCRGDRACDWRYHRAAHWRL